jgi:hypothetical protein
MNIIEIVKRLVRYQNLSKKCWYNNSTQQSEVFHLT